MLSVPEGAARLTLPPGAPVLALGAWSRNTICAAAGEDALVSATVGDLDGPDACAEHEDVSRAMLGWLRARAGRVPEAIAHDLHPDFHSTRVAAALAAETGARLVAVQHHHAHVAAVAAEHGMLSPVLGLAIDGTGLGWDGQSWGGELLQVEGATAARLGGLAPLGLPGGDRAAREPWRMAASVLHALGRGDEIVDRFPTQPAASGVARMLASGTRCPRTSSLGRLFDAAAGLLRLCETMRFEAEAAIALERAAAAHGPRAPLDGGWTVLADGTLDLTPLLAALASPGSTREPGSAAALFHATVGAAIADWIERAARRTGIGTVAAGGGCMLNRILADDLRRRVAGAGLRLLAPQRLSPGDAAIAFGQAAVARRALAQARTTEALIATEQA